MKTSVYFSILTIGVSSLMLNACSKKSEDAPAPTPPPTKVYGYVTLLDEFGNHKSGGSPNITVSTDSTSSSHSAVTDSSGKYIFTNLPGGTYDISFSGATITTYKMKNVGYDGGPRPAFWGTRTLYENCSATIGGNLTLKLDSLQMGNTPTDKGILATVQANTANAYANNRSQYCYVFVSNSNTVSSSNNMNKQLTNTFTSSSIMYTMNGGQISGTTVINIPVKDLKTAGFGKGSTLYVIAYIAPSSGYYYTDYSLQKNGTITYLALSAPSVVATIVLP